MKSLKPHLAYLRYVLKHKWFVFRAGMRFGVPLWRLIVHDFSKFSRAEWGAYVHNFYGESAVDEALRLCGVTQIFPNDPNYTEFCDTLRDVKERRRVAFDLAWLHHQHRNPHHWQHWILREDSGSIKVLVMPLDYVLEMVADWIGAGSKIAQRGVTLEQCARETAAWYTKNAHLMQMREQTRMLVESLLTEAALWGQQTIPRNQLPEPDYERRNLAAVEQRGEWAQARNNAD